MMIKQRKQEKGAIIIEIIAVVALLGVMGPMIFRQISDRNDEVENINIATEIRMVKEAFSSYIIFIFQIMRISITNKTVQNYKLIWEIRKVNNQKKREVIALTTHSLKERKCIKINLYLYK